MKTQTVKLQNLYTGEIVYTDAYHKFEKVNDVEFIMVYNDTNPNRKYLVNRLAYKILSK